MNDKQQKAGVDLPPGQAEKLPKAVRAAKPRKPKNKRLAERAFPLGPIREYRLRKLSQSLARSKKRTAVTLGQPNR
jgi:hypothetical protein